MSAAIVDEAASTSSETFPAHTVSDEHGTIFAITVDTDRQSYQCRRCPVIKLRGGSLMQQENNDPSRRAMQRSF
jgi:hypothetical protein